MLGGNGIENAAERLRGSGVLLDNELLRDVAVLGGMAVSVYASYVFTHWREYTIEARFEGWNWNHER